VYQLFVEIFWVLVRVLRGQPRELLHTSVRRIVFVLWMLFCKVLTMKSDCVLRVCCVYHTH